MSENAYLDTSDDLIERFKLELTNVMKYEHRICWVR
jgi:hypothetical protein